MRILDFHCHVYPHTISDKAAEAVARFYEVRRGEDIADQACALKDLLQFQAEAGIEKTVICSAATVPHQVGHINEFLARKQSQSQGRCIAFGTLHPKSSDVAGDFEHLLSLGLHGVKLHPDMQLFALNAPEAMEMYRIVDGRVPFLLHTGDKRYHYSNPENLRPVLEAFPNTTFIGAHMGGYTVWREAARSLAGKYPNLYVDVSSTMFALTPAEMVDLIHAYGVDHVFFGTDFPMWRQKDEVERFLALPLTDEEKKVIAWDNGAKLLGLS